MDALGAAEAVIGTVAQAEVLISVPGEDELDFVTLMCATEYLMFITAQRSEVDYERALHLLVEGTSKWRHIKEGL